jgi:hypothetical protein
MRGAAHNIPVIYLTKTHFIDRNGISGKRRADLHRQLIGSVVIYP